MKCYINRWRKERAFHIDANTLSGYHIAQALMVRNRFYSKFSISDTFGPLLKLFFSTGELMLSHFYAMSEKFGLLC